LAFRFSGGFFGLKTNPRKSLEVAVEKRNNVGWNAVFSGYKKSNLFISALQLAVLLLTLFIWIFGGGYMFLFEKDAQ